MQDTQTVEFSTFALCNCCLTSSRVTVTVESVSPLWQECFIWLPPKCRREIFIAFPSCPATRRPAVPSLYHTCSRAGGRACSLSCCCPGPDHLWEPWSSEWCHHFPASLIPASSDQHDKHLLLVCSLVPSPSSDVHTDVFFCLNKQNITLLFVFLTYGSFKWVSLSLYNGSEVCELRGKKRPKRLGNRGVRGTSSVLHAPYHR